jgi:sulfite oxidase
MGCPIDSLWPRRRWLAAMGILGIPARTMQAQSAAPETAPRIAGKRPMLVHNDFPEDLEALPEYFDTWITPTDAFFVRQHLPRPKVDREAWKLDVGGLVGANLSLRVAELRALPQHTIPATLECAGNGRKFYKPALPGLQWSKGGMGTAEWRGPRLSDVLQRAAPKADARYIDFDGADAGVASTPDFVRSLPLTKAMHESTILALDMNGSPLPDIHGGPARVIVPGWDGASWVKWVMRMTLVSQVNPGFFVSTAYRYPKRPGPPGAAVKPEDTAIVEGMPVKSFFTRPASDTKVRPGVQLLRGIAWAGEEQVASVEVSLDGGSTWQPAELGKENVRFAWRLWSYRWTPSRAGYHSLLCRATDSAGRTQPVEPYWNPSGYLWNGIDRVGILIEDSAA